jgi:vitamin B12 transporter
VFCLFVARKTTAQASLDSTVILAPVIVTQNRLHDFAISRFELPIDSTTLALAAHGSLADLLRHQGMGHLRSYGPGGLATASFRGSGSSHTAVLWNGIPIISPLSGQLDFSNTPVGLFEHASIQTGGSSSLSGNGAIGAQINLQNTINLQDGFGMDMSHYTGSFGYHFHRMGVYYSSERFASKTTLSYQASNNNFPYENRSIYPAKRMRREHAAQEQVGLLQQFHLATKKIGHFALKGWFQDTFYQIPNAISIFKHAKATEDNTALRSLFEWTHQLKSFDVHYQSAFIHHALVYIAPPTNEHATNTYQSILQNIEVTRELSTKAQLTTGIHATFEKSDVESFGNNDPQRSRYAFFGAYKHFLSPVLQWSIAAREERVGSNWMPFAPSLSIKYEVRNNINLFTNLARNYRSPTFNDLFWLGGGTRGNPLLKSEDARSIELGAHYVSNKTHGKAVVFSNVVDNWIQWIPNEQSAWVPHNIKQVWSRGIESQLYIPIYSDRIWNISFDGQYSFTQSTNRKVYTSSSLREKGKQLLLTPLHEGSATLHLGYKKFSTRLITTYTGKQYNDSDNTPYNIVKSQFCTNVFLSYQLSFSKYNLHAFGEINNLFDQELIGRPGYPLPGRNFKTGIQFKFKQPLSKKQL